MDDIQLSSVDANTHRFSWQNYCNNSYKLKQFTQETHELMMKKFSSV